MWEKNHYTYIMASASKVLYIGVTSNLTRRVLEHRSPETDSFTRKYAVHKLVWFEQTSTILGAIGLEKRLKGWRRERKVALIESVNPEWKDLAADVGYPAV